MCPRLRGHEPICAVWYSFLHPKDMEGITPATLEVAAVAGYNSITQPMANKIITNIMVLQSIGVLAFSLDIENF
jgi:hypothetical protein